MVTSAEPADRRYSSMYFERISCSLVKMSIFFILSWCRPSTNFITMGDMMDTAKEMDARSSEKSIKIIPFIMG